MTSSDPFDIPHIRVESGGHDATFSGSWYRGPHTNWIPSKAQLLAVDAVERFIMEGWKPRQPFITHASRITAFGSCFAQNISEYLAKRKYNVLGKDLSRSAHIIRFGEGMVNTFAIRQQFEWAVGERNFDDVFWIGPKKEIASHDPAIREETREIILSTDTFIITLGLSEIWYDKRSGEAFWRAIPKEIFDERRHGFRVSTVDENRENLSAIRRIVRSINANANIVLTLSPLPLMATFRPVSCLTANSVSKAILRVAIDECMRQDVQDSQMFYFPSYEIVNELFTNQRGEDNRHIRPEIIDFVMQTFCRFYCAPG
ncbi:MAG TPA: GSCFA domain-containing protein [Pseudolabrys sp.]|nr:GSCFA domain-containing protein [Pseudolabrys sp.]